MAFDNFKKKLLYRSYYRGCKESEVILRKFCDKFLEKMTNDQMLEFNEIIKLEDSDLLDFIMKKKQIPHSFSNNSVFEQLINFTQ